VCSCFTEMCRHTGRGAGLECRYDKWDYFSVGMWLHGVGATDVLMDEAEGACVV
jgi:hypothetical protein